jgi:CRISPR-associated protein Cmr4
MSDSSAKTVPVAGNLLGLYVQTSLHAGTGAALSAIDLPIQRERHTGWPIITGSAIKGVLRDLCREAEHSVDPRKRKREEVDKDDTLDLTAVFGPRDMKKSTTYAGAFNCTDARLLLMPVRSAKGVFAYVTCPGALARLARDAALVGWALPLSLTDTPGENQVVVNAQSHVRIPAQGNQPAAVVLEEHTFTPANTNCDAVATVLASLLPDTPTYAWTADRFKTHLAIVHDDTFSHFVRYSTEVNARIALDPETKTVEEGALFYQEFLPPESLLYSVLLADRPRRTNNLKSVQDAQGVLKYVADQLNGRSVVQFGGDATTGRGLCALRLYGVQPTTSTGNGGQP